ncbi:hypothetical protein [Chelatococcus asaccharovorans]|uniref:hypothetical protein n=1 Tax=Chelatococcus asaccharovorans TaxID=28210 RepID=UPI00224C6B74|nr:hypothetical protein [Chelatococcus asaccharovorans]CAH1659784.1 conserved hypothetical protein [Chelatococcus asaccharovorans]CAH1684063.1 conserved hypothetical protein [Chelatococcus asaccharovorans]
MPTDPAESPVSLPTGHAVADRGIELQLDTRARHVLLSLGQLERSRVQLVNLLNYEARAFEDLGLSDNARIVRRALHQVAG